VHVVRSAAIAVCFAHRRARRPGLGVGLALGFGVGVGVALVQAAPASADAAEGSSRPPESAPAETGPAESIPVLRTVVRGTRVAGLAEAPGAAVTVLDVGEADAGDSLADLIERAPGAALREMGGPGQAATLSLRGSAAEQVAVFLDGVRLTPPAGGGFDFSLVAPEVLERVEIVRGGDGALFGAGAVGGAVRLWTPRPEPGAAPAASAFASYGDFVTFRAGGSVRAGAGPVGVLAAGGVFHTDGRYPYVDDLDRARRRENSEADRAELLLRLAARAPRGLDVDATADLMHDDRGVEGPAGCPSATAHERDRRALAAATLAAHGLFARADRAALTLSGRGETFDFDDPAPCFGPRAPFHSRSGALAAALHWDVPIGDHVVRAALEAGAESLTSLALPRPATRPTLDATVSAALSFAAGRVVVAPAVRAAAAGGQPVALAPRLGVALSAGPASPWLVRASAGRAWRWPSFQELYVALDGIAGNPSLSPEDAWEADLGAAWRVAPRGGAAALDLEAGVFASRIANVILFAPVSGPLVQPDNYRGVGAVGGEASAAVAFRFGLAVRAGVSVARARLLSDPRLALPGRPDVTGSARAAWTAPWRRWPLEVWVRADGRGPTPLDRLNNLREEGRVLFAAGASLGVARGVTLRFEGRNLGDKRDAVDALQLPLPGRAFYGELRWVL
jgi:outer membrane cobalamin receptor